MNARTIEPTKPTTPRTYEPKLVGSYVRKLVATNLRTHQRNNIRTNERKPRGSYATSEILILLLVPLETLMIGSFFYIILRQAHNICSFIAIIISSYHFQFLFHLNLMSICIYHTLPSNISLSLLACSHTRDSVCSAVSSSIVLYRVAKQR